MSANFKELQAKLDPERHTRALLKARSMMKDLALDEEHPRKPAEKTVRNSSSSDV